MKGVVYDFIYVQNLQIFDVSMMGVIVGNYFDDVICFMFCMNLQVSDISGYCIGKIGIVGVGCSLIDICNVKLKNVGFDVVVVGDGIMFDFMSLNIYFDGVIVEVGDGYGFSGDLMLFLMVCCDFCNMIFGCINFVMVMNVGVLVFNIYVEGC